MPQDPQTLRDNTAPETFLSGKSPQTHNAAPGEHFSDDVFIIDDTLPGSNLDDIDEFHYLPMPVAHPVPHATGTPWAQQAAPGVPVVPGHGFPRDMFMIDLNDIGDCNDFDDLPATARAPMLAPIAGAAGNRPGALAPLTEFHSEIQPSPIYFPDQPAGYVFDEQVTDDTRQLWEILPRDVFWLIMGRAESADIVFE